MSDTQFYTALGVGFLALIYLVFVYKPKGVRLVVPRKKEHGDASHKEPTLERED